MSIKSILLNLREKIAGKLLSTEDLEELKAELEQDFKDAENGEFDDNEFMLEYCSAELNRVNLELQRRRR